MKHDQKKRNAATTTEAKPRQFSKKCYISVVKISTNVYCVQPRTLFAIIAAKKDTSKLSVNLQKSMKYKVMKCQVLRKTAFFWERSFKARPIQKTGLLTFV